MYELSGYAFAPLREGDIALFRGNGNDLSPILLATVDETSIDCVERLEHEYALKGGLAGHWTYRISCASRSPWWGRCAGCMSEALSTRTSSRPISWRTRQAAACG
jgi:hypothetical protein